MFKFSKQHQPVESNLFSNCVFYITGRTRPLPVSEASSSLTIKNKLPTKAQDSLSHFHIGKIIEANGGKIEWFFQRKTITHIIAQTLAAGKAHREYFQRAAAPTLNRVFIINPEWIFACLEKKKLVSEYPYLLFKPKNKDIAGYFSAKDDNGDTKSLVVKNHKKSFCHKPTIENQESILNHLQIRAEQLENEYFPYEINEKDFVIPPHKKKRFHS